MVDKGATLMPGSHNLVLHGPGKPGPSGRLGSNPSPGVFRTETFIYLYIYRYPGDSVFIYTSHALEKMDALGIEKRDVEETVRRGMKWKEEKSGKWHAQMAGSEVVFVKQDKDLFVITVYFVGRSK